MGLPRNLSGTAYIMVMDKELIDESVIAMLEAAGDGKAHQYDNIPHVANVHVVAAQLKAHARLVELAHELKSKDEGALWWNFNIQSDTDKLTFTYEGTIKRTITDVLWGAELVFHDKFPVVRVTFNGEVSEEHGQGATFDEKVVFLIDYFVSNITDWMAKVDAIAEAEKAIEDEECELE